MSHSTKNGSFGGYFSNSTPDFPPKCRHFGHPFAIILHLFGLKTIETLALNRFYPYSASPILKTGWSFTFKIPKRSTGKIFFAQAKVQQSAV
jgi:hypothetical protein